MVQIRRRAWRATIRTACMQQPSAPSVGSSLTTECLQEASVSILVGCEVAIECIREFRMLETLCVCCIHRLIMWRGAKSVIL